MFPLPPQITQAKFDAGIVRPRPPKAAIEAGETTQGTKPVGLAPSTSPTSEGIPRPDEGDDALEQGGDVENLNDVQGGGNVEDAGGVENPDDSGKGVIEDFGEPEAKVASNTTGPKWFDGEPTGDLGRDYAWQVLTAVEDIRVVWAPIASENDRHVTTTTGAKLARKEGIDRTRRDALLGASAELAEEVEVLKADLDEACRSLNNVLELLGDD